MQASLLSDGAAWIGLCSALDVIGDTELALEAYRQWQPLSTDGERYLLVYGVLQVMEVQQDAVRFVCESLSIRYSRSKELSDVRSIRNNSIGHPVYRPENKGLKSSFIQRHALTQQRFTLMTVFSDAKGHSRQKKQQIVISELLEMQRQLLETQLRTVVKELRSREMAHRMLYRDEKLEKLFPNWIGYLIHKCRESSSGLPSCMMELKEVVDRFRAALEARSEWRNDSNETYDIEILEHALHRLTQRSDDPRRLQLEQQDMCIYLEFIQGKFERSKKLRRI